MTASHITAAQPIPTPAPGGVGLGATLYFETVAAGRAHRMVGVGGEARSVTGFRPAGR